jgi:predicted NBD/HSP70 family sugar kinase
VVKSVLERVEAQDPVALRAVARTGRWLGLGIGNLLNPAVVVLGACSRHSTPTCARR